MWGDSLDSTHSSHWASNISHAQRVHCSWTSVYCDSGGPAGLLCHRPLPGVLADLGELPRRAANRAHHTCFCVFTSSCFFAYAFSTCAGCIFEVSKRRRMPLLVTVRLANAACEVAFAGSGLPSFQATPPVSFYLCVCQHFSVHACAVSPSAKLAVKSTRSEWSRVLLVAYKQRTQMILTSALPLWLQAVCACVGLDTLMGKETVLKCHARTQRTARTWCLERTCAAGCRPPGWSGTPRRRS